MPAKPRHFGAVLAALRVERGLSAYSLARRAGLSAQAVAKIEAGSVPSWETARRLAAALGVGLDDIAGRLPPVA